ncbi:MAG: hypothetical protein NT069_26620 [Planctomycetota bacterium]|nr:hypothetical protein [Planctomycetota bacterium]
MRKLMANPEELEVVRKGAKSLAEWWERNREARLHLDGANLEEAVTSPVVTEIPKTRPIGNGTGDTQALPTR